MVAILLDYYHALFGELKKNIIKEGKGRVKGLSSKGRNYFSLK